MLSIGECRICGTGPLGLRMCGHCAQVVVLCDECDAVWTDANVADQPIFFDDPELPCPGCSKSLWEPPSDWASQDEAEATDWIVRAVDEKQMTLEEGTPLGNSNDDDDDAIENA